jgi:hypothetical protein
LVELVAVRTADVRPAPEIELRGASPRRVTGPTLIQLDGSTGWVPGGWEGKSDEHGTWIVTRA